MFKNKSQHKNYISIPNDESIDANMKWFDMKFWFISVQNFMFQFSIYWLWIKFRALFNCLTKNLLLDYMRVNNVKFGSNYKFTIIEAIFRGHL